MLVLAGPLLTLFDAEGALLTAGISSLRVIALSFLFAGVSIILCSALQALGSANASLLISLLRQVILLLPAALALGALKGDLVWFAFLTAELISCGVAVLLYRRVYTDMMSRSHLIIIIGLAYNPVLYERVTAACKNRAAPGAAMTGKGYNGTPVQPQPCLRSE